MAGCLYQIEFPNGKSYIGITSKRAELRFMEHLRMSKFGKQFALYKALKKYGADTVKLKTLVIAKSWAYLKELERKAIRAFKTKGPDGYNMTDGGDGAVGFHHSEETKRKIRESNKTSNIGNQYTFGKPVPEERRKKISATLTGSKLDKPRHRKLTDEQVREVRKDFRSQDAIAKDYGMTQGQISRIKSYRTYAAVSNSLN